MSETAKRVLPYPAFLLLCILVVGALSCCAVVADAGRLEDVLERSRERRAAIWVDVFCRRLGCPQPVEIKIEIPANMPNRRLLAHTTRRGDGNGCYLWMLRATITDKETVAHEVCHCANDYIAIGPYGYQPGTPKTEIERRERAAKQCAANLARGRR